MDVNRNNYNKPIDWQFNTTQARIKIKHLYPKVKCNMTVELSENMIGLLLK